MPRVNAPWRARENKVKFRSLQLISAILQAGSLISHTIQRGSCSR